MIGIDNRVDEQCAVDTEPPEQLSQEDGDDYGRQRSTKTHQRLLENFVDEADRILVVRVREDVAHRICQKQRNGTRDDGDKRIRNHRRN